MRFSPSIKKKIQNLLKEKCIELQCANKNYSPTTSIWYEYLSKIQCARVPKTRVKKQNNFIFVQDPLYYDNYIKIKRETAEKIIVLGLP